MQILGTEVVLKVVFLRHGSAAPKKDEHTLLDDFRRPLVKKGEKEVKKTAKRARGVFSGLDVIYTSPLSRAVQTADIIYKRFPKVHFEIMPSLDKLAPAEMFIEDLKSLSPGNYCFTGHEPHLTNVLEILLSGGITQSIKLEMGGIAVLEGETVDDLKLTLLTGPNSF